MSQAKKGKKILIAKHCQGVAFLVQQRHPPLLLQLFHVMLWAEQEIQHRVATDGHYSKC